MDNYIIFNLQTPLNLRPYVPHVIKVVLKCYRVYTTISQLTLSAQEPYLYFGI